MLYKEGQVNTRQFACGINLDTDIGNSMRLFHNIGAIVTAIQSRKESYIPLNLSEAYSGIYHPLLLDRLALNALKEYDPGTFEEDINGWSGDPGGVLLNAEIRMAFHVINNQVKEQRKLSI